MSINLKFGLLTIVLTTVLRILYSCMDIIERPKDRKAEIYNIIYRNTHNVAYEKKTV